MIRFLKILIWPFKLSGREGWRRKLTWLNIWAVLGSILLSSYWIYLSEEPKVFDPIDFAQSHYLSRHPEAEKGKLPMGYLTGATFYHIGDSLLSKRGGYLSNDLFHPSVFLDNVPNWERGVILQMRDFVDILRRSVSISTGINQEQQELTLANSKFNIDPQAWMMPSAEGAYSEGLAHLHSFLDKLGRPNPPIKFFPRSDVLDLWLDRVFNRLAALSHELTNASGYQPVGGSSKKDERPEDHPGGMSTQNWSHIDDIFYQARGECWVIYHLMLAIREDYREVLVGTGNLEIFDQLIGELRYTLMPLYSPLVLSGYKFGLFANHSLALATYISRTKVLIVDLRSNLSI